MASPRSDPQPPDRSESAASTMAAEAGQPEGMDLLGLIGRAEQLSKEYMTHTVQRPLARAYRAWQNQHAEGSKYLGTAFKGRSRLYVPKTRSAVRKNLAASAAALFSTEDVVNISATYDDDDFQRATAAVIKADLDYRLNRTDAKSGLPWFLIAMGACLDGQLTGVSISKQYWEYEEVPTSETQTVLVPLEDEEIGEPVLDENGTPLMVEGEAPVMRATKDRPMVALHPIENAGLDPAAPWYDPAQLGRWFYMRYPMGLSDVRAMIASGGKNGAEMAWLDVSDAMLLKGRAEDEHSGSRRVREGGSDRYEQAKAPGELDIVWIQENFIRIEGIDYHFWSVGRHGFLSRVRETWEAYPEFGGERPYKFGVAQLDPHRVFPMSPVESWQPLQLEMNDIANLRLDTLKRSIAPLTIVKRGRNVDLTQMQRRGQPDAVLLADDPTNDVRFEATPGPSGQAYTETSVTNAQFDELAGVFSTSSVQTSRQMNETVGGMRLMSGAANAVSEFDLRIWVETWVEPVLRQVTHLVRYHESDERLLAIAGSKARVMTRFGYMPSLSDFDIAEVSLRVNVGIGAADPMQKLAKLKAAMDMLAPMFSEMAKQGININMESVIEEVMGAAGFKDGRRFFEFGEAPQSQPNPEIIEFMEKMKLEREKLDFAREKLLHEVKADMQETAADNATRLKLEEMKGQREAGKQAVGLMAEREREQNRLAHDRRRRIAEILTGRGVGPNETGRQNGYSNVPMVQPQAVPDAGMAVMNQMLQRIDAVSQGHAQMGALLQAIYRHMTAPAEIVRDPSGAPIGVRKGGRLQQIVRDEAGLIAGAVPLGANTSQ